MSQTFPAHYPITAVCLVADPNKCPPCYDLLLRSHDKKDDCDLWRESSVFKKVTRYLCFTRTYPQNGQNNVLAGLQVLNEGDFPPTGYSVIEKTVDLSAKASRKKVICVKLTNRDTTVEAINDIVLLSKVKRPPEGYTLAGDIHGILICIKLGKVPVETQQFQHSTPQPQRLAPLPPLAGYTAPQLVMTPNSTPVIPPVAAPWLNTGTIKRADSTLAQNPVADVTFQLNSKYQNHNAINFQIPEILYRSLIDIENEFNYLFTLEKSTIQRLPSSIDSN